MNSSGVTLVKPGMMLTFSNPSSKKIGQSKSASCAPATSVPSETFGAAFLAAIATAKCPRNKTTSATIKLLNYCMPDDRADARFSRLLLSSGCSSILRAPPQIQFLRS